jgi:hypothetical protein
MINEFSALKAKEHYQSLIVFDDEETASVVRDPYHRLKGDIRTHATA